MWLSALEGQINDAGFPAALIHILIYVLSAAPVTKVIVMRIFILNEESLHPKQW